MFSDFFYLNVGDGRSDVAGEVQAGLGNDVGDGVGGDVDAGHSREEEQVALGRRCRHPIGGAYAAIEDKAVHPSVRRLLVRLHEAHGRCFAVVAVTTKKNIFYGLRHWSSQSSFEIIIFLPSNVISLIIS